MKTAFVIATISAVNAGFGSSNFNQMGGVVTKVVPKLAKVSVETAGNNLKKTMAGGKDNGFYDDA